jgi:hypothetical protein
MQLVKTVIDQAHLRPTLQCDYPVYWSHDHALQLPFTPDVLILPDSYEKYNWPYEGCLVFNPGSLMADLSWMVYKPAEHIVEDSDFRQPSDF